MQDKLLKVPDVCALIGVSRATLYRLLSQKKFPPSVTLMASGRRWRESEIQKWMEELKHVDAA